MKQLVVFIFFGMLVSGLNAQPGTPESEQFFYNAKGLSYVPVMRGPGLIYEGHLYTGKKQLDLLMAKLNNPHYQVLYDRYRSGRSWATQFLILGTASSIIGLVGTNQENRSVNWWLFGAGIGCSAAYSIINYQSGQRLREMAVLMEQQNKSLGMLKSPSSVGIHLRIN